MNHFLKNHWKDVYKRQPEGLSLEGAAKLGEEVSEQYAVSPARFYVRRIIRPKMCIRDRL